MLSSVFTTILSFIVFACVAGIVAMQVIECLTLGVF